tara:strand:+ start:323 stop:535 length:213 start_codon:yes stop_codon:yes gene_type:complete
MKVYRTQEYWKKQKEYMQSQLRKAGKKIKDLEKEIENLKDVNKEHQKLNGKLREEIASLEEINQLMYEHP